MSRAPVTIWLPLLALLVVSANAAPQFEAASIKPAAPRAGGLRFGGDSGRIHYTSVTLREVISRAYQVEVYQVEGPEWLDAQQFDIDATLPRGAPDSQVPAMLQTLLAERFRLHAHWEDRSVNGYVLRLRGRDNQLKRSDAPGRGGVAFMGDKLQAVNATMAAFCGLLTNLLRVPVQDETDLKGAYDFHAAVEMENSGSPGIASILTAVRDLGLTLESRKLAMKHLIVDSADRVPTAN